MSKSTIGSSVQSWAPSKLGQVATCTLGGTPSTDVPHYWGGVIPWMSSGDVHLRRVHDVPGRITAAGLAASNATLVPPPAVAIALAGQGKTRGTAALTLCELSTNQSIALLRGDEERLHTTYLFHNLNRRYEELRARSSGGGRGGLSKGILESLQLELPPLDEQRGITEVLDTLATAIRQTEAIIEKLKQVKQG
ncbi:restriction endonuclease subunit S, partial [Rubrivivax gelatinosus]